MKHKWLNALELSFQLTVFVAALAGVCIFAVIFGTVVLHAFGLIALIGLFFASFFVTLWYIFYIY